MNKLKQAVQWCTLLATSCLMVAGSHAQNEENSALDDIITPDLERRTITEDDLDSEDWEIGIYTGIFSIEDFGSNTVTGARLAFHMTEDFVIELNYGSTTAGETTYETNVGDIQVLVDDNRDYTFYSISLAYNILPGEIFIGGKTAFNTDFYIISGVGNTTFNTDDYFTVSFGGGLRLYATDSIALHATVKDYVFENDVIGEAKQTNNLEASLGLSFYF